MNGYEDNYIYPASATDKKSGAFINFPSKDSL